MLVAKCTRLKLTVFKKVCNFTHLKVSNFPITKIHTFIACFCAHLKKCVKLHIFSLVRRVSILNSHHTIHKFKLFVRAYTQSLRWYLQWTKLITMNLLTWVKLWLTWSTQHKVVVKLKILWQQTGHNSMKWHTLLHLIVR